MDTYTWAEESKGKQAGRKTRSGASGSWILALGCEIFPEIEVKTKDDEPRVVQFNCPASQKTSNGKKRRVWVPFLWPQWLSHLPWGSRPSWEMTRGHRGSRFVSSVIASV